jgi:hypothetical protein
MRSECGKQNQYRRQVGSFTSILVACPLERLSITTLIQERPLQTFSAVCECNLRRHKREFKVNFRKAETNAMGMIVHQLITGCCRRAVQPTNHDRHTEEHVSTCIDSCVLDPTHLSRVRGDPWKRLRSATACQLQL